MKKLNKIGAIALSTAVMATSIFGTPATINKVSANTDTSGKVMTVEKFVTNYTLDENGKITIPKAKATSGEVSTAIYPLYSTEAVDATTVGDALQFVPEYSAYRVEYKIGDVVKSFVINVELVKPSVKFKTNSEIMLPSTTKKNTTLLIPYVDVKDSDGEALVNLDGDEYTDAELASKTSIKVYAPNGTLLTNTEVDPEKPVGTIEESTTTYVDAIKYMQFTPKAFGTYTVKYTFQADTTTQEELTKEVKVENNFETTRDISFTIPTIGTPVIGEEFTLPTPTVKDNTNDISGIEAYSEITVKCKKADGTKVDVAVNGYKFTPTIEGDYIITYKVKDAFGNESAAASYQITNVKDKKAPYDFKLVNSYNFTDNNLEDLEDYAYKLQSRMAVSTADDESTYLVIPAVYAKDNVTALQDLVVTRTVKSYSVSANAYTVEEAFNKTALYKVENAGTYTVTYTVEDKANGNKIEKSYQVIVQENYEDVKAPEITFDSAITKNAKAGDTIKFNKPSAVDYRDDNKNTGDTRLNLKTYYYIDADVDNKVLINEDEKDSTKLSFVIPSNFAGSKITILTICIDDLGNQAEKTHEISVVNDTQTPAFVEVGDFEASYMQGGEITIPNIKVTDNYLNSVSVNVEVTDKNGSRVLVNGLTYQVDGDNIVVSGAKFFAVQSGEYTIKVVARDGNDNLAIFTHTINAIKTSTPIIKVDTDDITVELGDEVDLNIFSAWDDGEAVAPEDIVISGVPVENNVFKATTIGNWVATFTYNYEVAGNPQSVSKDVNITVQDTTAPVITFNGDTFVDTAYKPNVSITIPTPIVTDNSDENCDLDIVIMHDGEEIVFSNNSFTPTKDGTYTVTYTATDVYGNANERSFTITVGDKTGPVIDLGDESINAPSSMKKGSTLTLDATKITVYDEYETKSYEVKSDNVTITLKDSNGNTVANTSTSPTGFSFKLDSVGSYTLTYKAKDGSGNTTTITKTIEVSDDAIDESNVGDTGMVLAIIVALAILAGVIFFFFKPEKQPKVTDKKKD